MTAQVTKGIYKINNKIIPATKKKSSLYQFSTHSVKYFQKFLKVINNHKKAVQTTQMTVVFSPLMKQYS